jgi:hypothetical protein
MEQVEEKVEQPVEERSSCCNAKLAFREPPLCSACREFCDIIPGTGGT